MANDVKLPKIVQQKLRQARNHLLNAKEILENKPDEYKASKSYQMTMLTLDSQIKMLGWELGESYSRDVE
jgi:predicted metal-dependent hydrolase